MSISRGQTPRQLYGLGSFIKKITKPVKKVVSKAKDFVKSDLGKAAILGVGLYGLPGGFGGIKGIIPQGSFLRTAPAGIMEALSKGGRFEKLGSVLRDVAIGTGVAGLTDYFTRPKLDPSQERIMGRTAEEIAEVERELRQNYENLGYSDKEIDILVEQNMKEYAGRAINAYGGRIGYAMGDTAEDNAMQASGIMGLPLNENPAGVTELDLRNTGGFIPPVGVKEKADDIPAMLSNNEFVFTADAVRGMGDGDVNKGAERMYSMMKQLENGGRV